MQLDSNGLYDIYPVWHIPFWQTTWFYFTVGSIGAVLVLIIVILIIKKLLRRKHVGLTPYQEALQRLHALQKKQYTSEGQAKQCYFIITDTLKHYLQARFDISMEGKSDEEAAAYLAAYFPAIAESFKAIADGALYIKFANQQALAAILENDIARAITLIEQTKPSEKK